MIKISIAVLSAIFIGRLIFISFPSVKISNGIIKVGLYLPDPDRGYYRATRFDWSGVISDIEYGGHTFVGQWFDKYEPTIHDAITGPAESYAPLGYNEVRSGNSFTQIGVGTLLKPTENSYSPFRYYEITDHGRWKIKKQSNEVKYTHKITSGKYPYEYVKKIELVKGEPEMVITHSLRNLGRRRIETEVYNHNFFLIDSQVTGPDITIEFPFDLNVVENGTRGVGEIAQIKNNRINFLRKLAKDEYVYSILEGYGCRSSSYDIKIENRRLGVGLRIRSSRPISKLVFWASSSVSCPEPYTKIEIPPGGVFKWNISYKFFTVFP